jgi:hypothetical protein
MNSAGKPVINKIRLPTANTGQSALSWNFPTCHTHAPFTNPSEKLEFAYFPNAALGSVVVAKGDGKTVEASLR